MPHKSGSADRIASCCVARYGSKLLLDETDCWFYCKNRDWARVSGSLWPVIQVCAPSPVVLKGAVSPNLRCLHLQVRKINDPLAKLKQQHNQ